MSGKLATPRKPFASWHADTSGYIGDDGKAYIMRNEHGQISESRSRWKEAFPLTGSSVTGSTIVSLAFGGGHQLALDTSGTVYAWGYNMFGQLGDDSIEQEFKNPIIVNSGSLVGTTIVSVACGRHHSMAIDTNGTLHSCILSVG